MTDIYWQTLGVPLWRLRDISSQPMSFQSYLLLTAQGEKLAIALAKIDSIEEQELFSNIVNALGVQVKSIENETLPRYSALESIVFGQQLADELSSFSRQKILVVCDLQSMIKDPSLKKEVWQKIRIFKKSS